MYVYYKMISPQMIVD